MPLTTVADFARSQGWEVRPETLERMEAFADALYEANSRANLTRVSREQFELRHLIDSLLIAEFLPSGAAVLDIGSGAGFPAWPLACLRQDLAVTALDSSGKAVRFLSSQPLPNLRVVEGRAEERPFDGQFDVVTGRAVSPLGIQLELSARPCKLKGLVIPFRTGSELSAAEQVDAGRLGLQLESCEERAVPVSGEIRLFPIYRKLRATPREYPRTWAKIRSCPL